MVTGFGLTRLTAGDGGRASAPSPASGRRATRSPLRRREQMWLADQSSETTQFPPLSSKLYL